MLKKPVVLLGLLVLFLLVLRSGILLTSVESTAHYDEIDLGTIAREIILGPRVPFHFFQLDAYSGESFILGPMVVPFFKLFGENLFAIKMVPLLFSLLTLVLVFCFMKGHYGLKAALYAGVLFVFAPPGLVQLSLVTMTGHTEAFFFGFAALALLYEFLFSGKKIIFLFLAGLVSGAAVWFYYANAILITAFMLVFLLADRRLFFRTLPLFSAGFLMGFSPWLATNLKNHFMGLELVGENLGGFNSYRLLHVVKKPAALLLLNIPGAFASLPVYFIPAAFFSYIYYGALLAAVIPFAAAFFKDRARDPKSWIWFAYPVVYFCVLMVSQFDPVRTIGFVGFRYVTPLLFMLLAAAGIWLSAAQNRRPLFILLVFLGLAGQLSLLFKEPWGRALNYTGTSYYQLGTRWHFNQGGSFQSYDDFMRQTAGFSENERRMILWGLIQMAIINTEGTVFEPRPGYARDLNVHSMVEKEAVIYRPFAYEWLGAVPEFRPPQGMPGFEAAYQKTPEQARGYFCQGWLWSPDQSAAFMDCPDCYPGKETCDSGRLELAALFFGNMDEPAWKARLKKIPSFPAEEKKKTYRGLGRALFLFENVLNPLARTETKLDYAEPSAADVTDINWGVGWGIRERFREDRVRAMDWIARLPPGAQVPAKQGLEAFERWYEIIR